MGLRNVIHAAGADVTSDAERVWNTYCLCPSMPYRVVPKFRAVSSFLVPLLSFAACSDLPHPSAPPDSGDERAPTASDGSAPEASTEGGNPDRGDSPDVETGDASSSTDAPSETGDAPSETGDAPSETSDAPSETSDAPSEAGDGGCACVPPKTGTVTIPLHCYCATGCPSIDDTSVCVALPGSGRVVIDTYECNIIGITRATGGPSYTWFYDATTKELVGARTVWTAEGDPRTCRSPGPDFELTILAGTIPTCAVAGSRTLCLGGDASPDGEVEAAADAHNERDAMFDAGFDGPQDRDPDGDGADERPAPYK